MELIQDSVRSKALLKAIGSETSKSACFLTSGTSVDVRSLNHIERLSDTTVRVGGGATIFELDAFLRANRLSLSTLGEWRGQTLAGALSTGTHGGSAHHGSLCSSVVSVKLIDGLGNVQSFSRGEEGFSEMFPSLGLLGVIVEVVLEAEPLYYLKLWQQNFSLEDFIKNYSQWTADNEFFAAVWLPALNSVAVFAANRVDSYSQLEARELRYSFRVVSSHWLSTRRPRLAQWWWSRAGLRLERTNYSTDILAPIQSSREKILRMRKLVRQPLESEFSIATESTPRTIEALARLFHDAREVPPAPLGIRPGASESFSLSPCYGRASTWISLFWHPGKSWSMAARDILQSQGARSHWGKDLFLDPEYLERQYPQWTSFLNLRKRLDPHSIFENEFSKRVFARKDIGN